MIANFWRRVGLCARACLQKEGLAFIALMVSLCGAGIISAMLLGNLIYLRNAKATDSIFYLSCGMLFLIFIVLMSSHRLLGSRQAIEAEAWKLRFKISQGHDEVVKGDDDAA
jgi:hypothetical protein